MSLVIKRRRFVPNECATIGVLYALVGALLFAYGNQVAGEVLSWLVMATGGAK